MTINQQMIPSLKNLAIRSIYDFEQKRFNVNYQESALTPRLKQTISKIYFTQNIEYMNVVLMFNDFDLKSETTQINLQDQETIFCDRIIRDYLAFNFEEDVISTYISLFARDMYPLKLKLFLYSSKELKIQLLFFAAIFNDNRFFFEIESFFNFDKSVINIARKISKINNGEIYRYLNSFQIRLKYFIKFNQNFIMILFIVCLSIQMYNLNLRNKDFNIN